MNQQSLTTQADTACRGRRSVHNGVALFPIDQPGSEPPHWPSNESGMAGQQRTDEPKGAMPGVAHRLLPPPFLEGTLQASAGLQLLAQTVKLSPVQDEQHQTFVCKRLTNSDESLVLSVSQALERTPFLTMDNRFKVLNLPQQNPTETADALSELREQGTIKAFFEVCQAGLHCFTVEYP